MPQPDTANARLPRFRRAAQPPAFRVTDGDIAILEALARFRFLRSSHLAQLVGRSLDRTNDRLCRLFHAGYVDRPRAQLDYYPDSGSAPMLYALADIGARLLREQGKADIPSSEWSRKNASAGRPFIEHQLGIVEFQLAMERAAKNAGAAFLTPEAMLASAPEATRKRAKPFALTTILTDKGAKRNIGLVPDLSCGLRLANGDYRNFMVEIDRGTMPVTRSNIAQTSFARKFRGYQNAHAERLHEQRFGWRSFRVLTVTTNEKRMRSMIEALQSQQQRIPRAESLFLFTTKADIESGGVLGDIWRDGSNAPVRIA